ncbi:MAG TPA: tRNA nucleotidyltransferase, partial [Saprospiraceae bacterium]|nr:tRNA nucleotidyltransferase [Saprospiraceae bacterium]
MENFHLYSTERDILNVVQKAAELLNIQAYLVGGFVRDRLLGRPCKDLDIVCTGDGILLAETAASMLPGKPKVSVFQRFGTAMLRFRDMEIEFVGARKESYVSDSRKPYVEAG